MPKIDIQKLGFTENESRIYPGLFEYGQSSITELANKLEMNRVTVHFNVQDLIKKGIISHIKFGSRKKLRAEDPSILQEMLSQKTKQLTEIEDKMPIVLQQLKELSPNIDKSETDLKYHKGKRSIKLIYEDILKAKEIRAYVTEKLDNVLPESNWSK